MVRIHRFCLVAILFAVGCHHGQRQSCCAPEGCAERCVSEEAPRSCSGAAPAAPSAPYEYAAPQSPMFAQAPVYASAPAYTVMAAPAAPSAPESGVALGMGVLRLPIPFPKLIAVPKAPRNQPMQAIMVQQQAPMMQAPMMQAPMMQAPVMQAPAAPQICQSQDAELLAKLLLQGQQRSAPSAGSAAAAPISDDEQEIADRTEKLEKRVNALIDKLEAK